MPVKTQKLEYLLVAGGLLLFSLFAYFIKEAMTPLWLFFALIFLLLPLRQNAFVKHFILLIVLLFFVWLLKDASQIITPFLISFALAYLFDPLVVKMEEWKIKRWISVLAIVLFVLAVLVLLSILLVPVIIDELTDLIKTSITYSDKITSWLGKRGNDLLPLMNFENGKLQEFLITELPGKIQQVIETVFKGALNITAAISTAVGQLLNLVLIPFLFFYILKDFDRIKQGLSRLLRLYKKSDLKNYAGKIDLVISGFFRGQLTVCLIVAVLTSSALAVFNVKYALIIGIMAGVLNIIPYVGLLITLAFSVMIALFNPNPLMTALKIVAIIEIVQIIEGSFLSPKIVGDRVGLHPVWVMFSILIFAYLFGFVGLVLAVPIAATLKIFVVEAMNRIEGPAPDQIS